MLVVKTFSRITNLFLPLLIICFISHLSYAAGSGIIKGHIVDKSTGEPLIGANIIILNTSLGVATDVTGGFVLRTVPPGEWTLRVSYLGYKQENFQVVVKEGEEIEKDFKLEPQSLVGEEVIVTAQARGQQDAINQQLASNTISNVVAADRIKALPDASAAESIGRLPGVSIDRYNGEAVGIAVRGLSPKYNVVTVNGVALPATSNTDRTVDLSLISSNLLDGIEVKKANTADMDADALGGTIDLRLKEAPEEFQVNGSLQGGHNSLVDPVENYSANVSVSDRFFANKLGIIFGLNVDRNNRTADKRDIVYDQYGDLTSLVGVRINQIILERDEAIKNRFGGNLLLDYSIPYGKVAGNGFYNEAKTDGIYRKNTMDFKENKHYYLTEQSTSTTSIYTLGLGAKQDFGWIKYNVDVSATGSKTTNPNDWQWQFNQESNNQTGYPTTNMTEAQAYRFVTAQDSITVLQSVNLLNKKMIERTKAAQFNVEIPYRITDNINGTLKAGGKFRWIDREFNQELWGRSGMAYGGFWESVGKDLVTALSKKYPNDFNYARDSAAIAYKGWWLLPSFYRGYAAPPDFLDGAYKLGKFPDIGLMQKLADVFPTLGNRNWQRLSSGIDKGSLGADYDGIEQYQAFYIMTELHAGPFVTFIPGVRYDADYTKYHGQTFKALNQANNEQPPLDYRRNENIRKNNFWLPQIHIKLHPLEWLRVHMAYTQSITRPDYNMYAPITSLDQYGNYLDAANAALKDSRTKNVDAALSVYEPHAGLITISGFYKRIDNLIMYQAIPSVNRPLYKLLLAEGIFDINAPENWFIDPPGSVGSTPQINTWLNNPTPAQYRGVELDWQTNFWFLPSALKGLVFNLNWTYIISEIDLHSWWTRSQQTYHYDPITDRDWFTYEYSIYTTTRKSRMPGQPAHILNTTIGYDFEEFSFRLSYLYQSDKFRDMGLTKVVDGYTRSYDRWDLAVSQKVGKYIQIFLNFNNLTNTHDETVVGYSQDHPKYREFYGQTIDLGIRVNY